MDIIIHAKASSVQVISVEIMSDNVVKFINTPDWWVKPRYNAGRGRKNFEAKNRVIARSAL